jgi:pimeloyl-ACP methyl ester carboxylesterase
MGINTLGVVISPGSGVVATVPARQAKGRSTLVLLWSDWRIGFVAVLVLALASALLTAWLMPRGPITTTQALTSMAGALVLGIIAGLVLGSRWSMLVAPVAFTVFFEVARLGVSGPTVDEIRLGSIYGIFAFALGRGLTALLILAPMVAGARFGVELAARLGRDSTPFLGWFGWGLTGLATIGLGALAVAIALPGTTAPIRGSDGRPIPGSVAELTTVPLGGHDQAMMIRGRSVENPVLLYLAGGPGGTDLGAMRADVGLEQDFVVVTWDQRGVGKSYAALDPVETMTVGQAVADTIELTNYLRDRFDEDRIYVVGNSWGSFLGAMAVQQRPDLYHAFVSTGQMVSTVATDTMFYEDTLAWAERNGDIARVAALLENGSPPYANLLDYELALSFEHDWNPYPELDPGKELPFNLFVPENSLMDKANGLRSFLDTFSVLYPELNELDFRRDLPELRVPVYLVLGVHEARGRAIPATEWFEMLEAPTKERIIFEHSGHRPQFEEPEVFATLMARVLAETQPDVAHALD